MSWRPIISILIIAYFASGCKDDKNIFLPFMPPFEEINEALIDSLVNSMTIEEKIGQLIVLKTKGWNNNLEYNTCNWVRSGKVSGVIMNDLPLFSFIGAVDSINRLANIPLFIGSESKFLINNQFSNLGRIPDPETFYALPTDTLKDKLKDLFVKQLLVLGINFNIGPEIDEFLPSEHVDPGSYFQSQPSVSPMFDILNPMRDHGILNIGDGITAQNLLNGRHRAGLDSLIFPYQELVRLGISGFKVDSTIYAMSGLAKYQVRRFLSEAMEFEGLLVADLENADQMEEMVLGGSDLIIVQDDPTEVYDYIKFAVQQDILPLPVVDQRLRRVLKAKAWMNYGLDMEKLSERFQPRRLAIKANNLVESTAKPDRYKTFTKFQLFQHFTNRNWDILDRQLYENSIILAHNNNNILPFANIYKRQFQVVHCYTGTPFQSFQRYFNTYAANVRNHYLQIDSEEAMPLLPRPIDDATYIVLFHGVDLDPERDKDFLEGLKFVAQRQEVVLINFGNYENLRPFNPDFSLVQIFERNESTESLAAQMLFGAVSARGVLPFDINEYFRADQGTRISGFRLKYAQAEEVGISAEKLVSIDAIANSAIDAGAMPGCQVLVAKDGRIIYSKAFGHHTYENSRRVRPNDLYDIASLTKVAATTLAAMKLYDERQYKLTDRLKEHLPLEDRASIRNIRVRSLLTHESGLQPNMPITSYVLVRDSTRARYRYFQRTPNPPYTIAVADSIYFNQNYLDTIWTDVQSLGISKRQGYRYSDVNFVLLQRIVEELTQVSLDSFLNENFYGPMGLGSTLFNPLTKLDTANIVPTQFDEKWRKQLLRGFVHDETAALMGGVSGNAGLFSNAEELAIIFQMFLNRGTYGGKAYLRPRTVDFFTAARHGNHRGLGFDKPYPGRQSALAKSASPRSYGHTGFTGTCAWVDPDHDLVYIFLSNRIHPDRSNFKLIQLQVRERIHQVIYDALDTHEKVIPDLDLNLEVIGI